MQQQRSSSWLRILCTGWKKMARKKSKSRKKSPTWQHYQNPKIKPATDFEFYEEFKPIYDSVSSFGSIEYEFDDPYKSLETAMFMINVDGYL